ncbi:hypothetical protein [Tenacibaculum sp. SG-28]|uniref:hypothetical protein n=1 Tax=Tenacibaculum sp. SG-28 TaxID=754426 RepID=UPI000CF46C01|nr:hypothetical protein [Tenacibaculum sp. SG-28]PQJ21252.1 hypothetical protein BSU00_09790 [Tenacibaculum sp. SG-28]
MIRKLIFTTSTLITILFSFQSAFGQNYSILKGKVIDYSTNQYLPAVKIETFNKGTLLDKTDTSLEDGSFTLSNKMKPDKIIISLNYYYPIIIENINKIKGNELNLETIRLIEIPITFTRYFSKKAEREGRKEEKRKFKRLEEGIIINSNNRNYKMKLKKYNDKFAFYIDYKDFQKD